MALPAPITSRDGIDFTRYVILKGESDNSEFLLSFDAAKNAELITEMTQERDPAATDPVVVEISKTGADVIQLVVQYLEYHKDNKAQAIDKDSEGVMKGGVNDNITESDKAFLYEKLVTGGEDKTIPEMLINVTNAAHFLRIGSLKELGCMWVATKLRSMISQKKSVVECAEEIREYFGVERGYNNEEYEQLKFMCAWVDE